ncbi:MAG TPA: S24 family peptidase [Xanthobacteraceae bacterium]|jgi:hypothetical protein|nr:S24 family peptidase [Xanthobacteraceae bacterium]
MHRIYLRQVVEKTGTPPTRIARDIGIAPSTLTRLLNEADGSTATLHAGTLAKLERYSGIAPPSADGKADRPPPSGLQEEAAKFEATGFDQSISAALKALIDGRSNAHPWIIKTRALEYLGYMPGDIVIVDLDATPQSGDAVCAQIYDWHRGSAETIFRLYETPYLMSASNELSTRKPLLVDGERVVIMGVLLPHRLRATRR